VNEFLRCLQELDVAAARRLWSTLCPSAPQPQNDYEMLINLHLARINSKLISPRQKAYSRKWLRERDTGGVVNAVGLAIRAPVHRMKRALNIRSAMEDAVERSIKAGLDLDLEATEVRNRIILARDKEMGFGRSISAAKVHNKSRD
jgi:hypothetical protein